MYSKVFFYLAVITLIAVPAIAGLQTQTFYETFDSPASILESRGTIGGDYSFDIGATTTTNNG